MAKKKRKSASKKPLVDGFISKYGILIVYALAIISYLIAVKNTWHWFMLVPVFVFIIYDVWYRWIRHRKNKWGDAGRDYQETVASISSASNYVSFFIAFIAVAIGLLFDNEKIDQVKDLFKDQFISFYGFLVLALSGVVLLFIPISYKKHDSNEPSTALKNCFFSVLLMEKIIILLLVYLIMQIAMLCL